MNSPFTHFKKVSKVMRCFMRVAHIIRLLAILDTKSLKVLSLDKIKSIYFRPVFGFNYAFNVMRDPIKSYQF